MCERERDEDRRKQNQPCSGRGLGLAAAAIGVGVGAALYYFLNKRSEQPDSAGSTSQNWTYEEPTSLSEKEQLAIIRQEAFRERSWSLEECSICFEVMLLDQPLMKLPCAHSFHVACIGPWLREHQTCPNCRKAAE